MADILDIALFTVVILLIVVVVVLLLRKQGAAGGIDPKTMATAVAASLEQSSSILKGAFAESLREMKIEEEIGAIKSSAESMINVAQQIQTLFVRKGERAQWAEMQLIETLRDVFPPNKLRFQKDIPGIGRPDAHLLLTEGILCIDAKFPLENYQRWNEAISPKDKRKFAAAFREDVRKHVEKIRRDYVKPEAGTLGIAYAYMPSGAIFGYLVENETELLREAAARGVVVCSPSTLLASLNLVWTAERAVQITEQADEIENNIRRLVSGFEGFEGEWDILRRHIQNAYTKMQDAHTKYVNLKTKFEATAKLEIESLEEGD